MDYEALTFWSSLVQLAITSCFAVYVSIIARTRYNAKRLDEHEAAVDDRLDRVEQMLARLDERAAHAPDSEALGKLHARLDRLTETVAQLTGAVGAWKETVAMVSEFLLNERKR